MNGYRGFRVNNTSYVCSNPVEHDKGRLYFCFPGSASMITTSYEPNPKKMPPVYFQPRQEPWRGGLDLTSHADPMESMTCAMITDSFDDPSRFGYICAGPVPGTGSTFFLPMLWLIIIFVIVLVVIRPKSE